MILEQLPGTNCPAKGKDLLNEFIDVKNEQRKFRNTKITAKWLIDDIKYFSGWKEGPHYKLHKVRVKQIDYKSEWQKIQNLWIRLGQMDPDNIGYLKAVGLDCLINQNAKLQEVYNCLQNIFN
jgi:hypothetical protein